jgi:tellurite resistance protein TerC
MTLAIEWIAFNVFVVLMLVLDLTVFHRKSHVIRVKEALLWSAFWISLALIFNVGVYFVQGPAKALQFLTGYLLEESLSVDNLFVILLIFTYFKVPALYQHNVLFWGILGAQVMRAIFIFSGVALLHHFHWIIYIFGAFLIYTAFKLIVEKEKEVDPEKNVVLKLFRRVMPVTPGYHENKFFIRLNGKLHATPLFVVLLVVETTDLIFAVDSIPAILAITTDTFIVYTSNIFAILGLRALYFALAGLMGMFRYLHYGLGAILAFVGVKMLIVDFYKIPIGIALGFIVCTLALTIFISLRKAPPKDLDEKKIQI